MPNPSIKSMTLFAEMTTVASRLNQLYLASQLNLTSFGSWLKTLLPADVLHFPAN